MFRSRVRATKSSEVGRQRRSKNRQGMNLSCSTSMAQSLGVLATASLIALVAYMRGSCCTSRAHPALQLDLPERGQEILVEGIACYEVAPVKWSNETPALLVFSDIFGWRSGRTRQLCDQLAEEAGMHVLLPNLFYADGADHSKPLEGFCGGLSVAKRILYYDWSDRQKSWHSSIFSWPSLLYPFFWSSTTYVEPMVREKLLPYFRDRTVGVLGFCWGGWIAFHLGKHSQVQATVAMHPSMRMQGFHGGTSREVYEAIRCPVMCLTAGDDPQDLKPGGELSEVLAAQSIDSSIEEFSDMRHGWVPRGKTDDPSVAESVTVAMQKACRFLQSNLFL